MQTPYKSFKHSRTWNEWLEMPIEYCDVQTSAQIAITIWDYWLGDGRDLVDPSTPFGGTTVPLFNEDGTLRQGRQRCYVHRGRKADGNRGTSTPAFPPKERRGKAKVEPDADMIELERLEELIKKHEMGEIKTDPWLDELVTIKITELEKKVVKKLTTRSRKSTDELDPGQYFLYIDFPRFDHPVVFTDFEYPPPPISTLLPQSGDVQLKPPPEVTLGPGIDDDEDVGPLFRVWDPEAGMKENPVETKHRRLVRNQRTGVLDRDLRPNAKIRDELTNIIAYGPTQELKSEEKDLIWKFRHHLTRNKRALTKFIKSVSWTEANEAAQAVRLLPQWTEIDVDDALELLGPGIDNQDVRAYAVDRLRKSEDEELLLYLLQLVQALKFETIEDEAARDSSLAQFLISRATRDVQLGIFLHWYLLVECDDLSTGQAPQHRKLFAKVEYDFMTELVKRPDGNARRRLLLRQGELIAVLSKISKEVRFSKEDRLKKIDRLKTSLADPKNELVSFDPPLALPLDPSVDIIGCFPDESNVFKSSLFPLLITFKTATGDRYPVIFKTGDDLRQDQLVIQIIMLMDRLLQKENLDLKLTPYRILATSTSAGAVQFVPSTALANIASKYKGSVLAYLRAHNPDSNAPLGVKPETMDIYIKSCAGYCVITYLLGVGDRHLDNLLIAPTGHFFHADFGYILGRDPKPFAPLMKLSKEMIEGMGGAQSTYYRAFKQHCFTAYTTLRKSSNLILNLFSLMVDANIPDIRMEPDKAVEKVKERFHLELRSEEEVIRMFDALIEDSMGAMFPALIDWTHGIVQRFRT